MKETEMGSYQKHHEWEGLLAWNLGVQWHKPLGHQALGHFLSHLLSPSSVDSPNTGSSPFTDNKLHLPQKKSAINYISRRVGEGPRVFMGMSGGKRELLNRGESSESFFPLYPLFYYSYCTRCFTTPFSLVSKEKVQCTNVTTYVDGFNFQGPHWI